MRRRAALLALPAALALTSCGAGAPVRASHSGGRAGARSAAGPGASPDRLATNAAYAFLDTYTVDGGRIQRSDQGGDTVGEGQAYGMLAAAAVGDPTRFQRIWSWTRANMLGGDGLLAFRWVQGHVVDANAAADADLDAARALLVASCRFHRRDLGAAAVAIGRAVLAHETARAGTTEVLLAGPWAQKAGQLIFNPSYVDPTTLDALARATGSQSFRALADGGTRLVAELARPLPPDWATVDAGSGRVTPVASASSSSGPGMFTFDAPRTLVRFATAPDPAARRAVARAWNVFSATQPQDVVSVHALSGTALGNSHSPVTLVAAAGAARASGDAAAVPALLNEAEQLDRRSPSYYGGAWVALGRLLLQTGRLAPCSR